MSILEKEIITEKEDQSLSYENGREPRRKQAVGRH
jgi:hypothetical protein